MRGRAQTLVIGLLAVVALLGCSDNLGQALGQKVEAGGTSTPTIVALPPKMTAATTTAPSTTTVPTTPATTLTGAQQSLAPPAPQLREPAATPTTGQGTGPTVAQSPTRSVAPTTVPPTTPPATAAPRALEVSLTENPFRCDSKRRAFGTVSNALAGEQVGFYASGIGELVPGSADGNGTVTIHWRCDPNDAGAVWAITATGAASGRSAAFQFRGTTPEATATTSTTATPPTTAAGPKTLSVALSENPFRCDSNKRVFGRVSGAAAGETVSLSESYNGPLVSGVADANGEFSVRWSCPPSSAGATWTITATGNSSGRTVRFSFTGA